MPAFKIRQFMRLLPVWALLVLLAACGQNEPKTTAPALPAQQSAPTYPLLPASRAKAIIEACDYIDLVMYQMSFSINISDPNNARGLAASVMSNTPPPHTDCRDGFGTMTFLRQGELIAEAEVFFQQGCTYLLFKENGQRAYTCAIPPRGIEFFNGLVQQQQRARQNAATHGQ